MPSNYSLIYPREMPKNPRNITASLKSQIERGLAFGYDPGGNGAQGVALLRFEGGRVISLSTQLEETTEDVFVTLAGLDSLAAIGVDTLTCWSTGPGAWRPADLWLRKKYPAALNSVMTPNRLSGSMGLNGMCVLIEARKLLQDIQITETHPKVLYNALFGKKYDYGSSARTMDTELSGLLGISVHTKTEHEWDAAISAFAAFQGILGRWTYDLHSLPLTSGARLIHPCGKTNYFWPE